MKKIFLATLIFIQILSLSIQADMVKGEKSQRDYEISRIKQLIEKIEHRYISQLSSGERREAVKDVNEIQDLLDKLRYKLKLEEDWQSNRTLHKAMESQSFSDLVNRVRAQPFKDEQFRIIETAGITNYFRIEQVSELAKIFIFEDDRFAVIKILFDKVIDKENSFRLYDLLNIDKDDLQKLIEKKEAKG